MPDCGVHYLWFAFVCFLIRSHPPHVLCVLLLDCPLSAVFLLLNFCACASVLGCLLCFFICTFSSCCVLDLLFVLCPSAFVVCFAGWLFVICCCYMLFFHVLLLLCYAVVMQNTRRCQTIPPPPCQGKRRVALFGHAGNAWCLYPTLIADDSY